MPDLSVLIPARNERWLRQTVEDVLSHATGDTEVIVVCDGEWPIEPLTDHPKLHLLKVPQPVGQRAATNLAAKVATGRYVMKLDAHCAVAPGFDTQLVTDGDALGPDVTQVPRLYNLHIFQWHCAACGHETYQGPTPTLCGKCQAAGPFERVLVWQPRWSRKTDFMRFDRDLHFQYWGDYGRRPEAQGEIADLMSCLGACWVMPRERFWQLGGLDEGHGSWGAMGTEVACKSWLSGGRMVANKRTWYSHLFRTSGGDFGFPYPLSGKDIDRARAHSRRLWIDGTWPLATRPLSWLIQKFAPVPTWDDVAAPSVSVTLEPATSAASSPTVGLVYYSDLRLDPVIAQAVRAQLTRCLNGHRLVSSTLGPLDFGQNLAHDWQRGALTMFKQILAGLEALDTDVAFLVEHDVVYHPSHFAFRPARQDRIYYNQNVWKVHAETGHALHYLCNQTSGLCAHRDTLLQHYRARVARVEAEGFSRRIGFEPGTRKVRHGGIDDLRHETWFAEVPNIDLRHGQNLTSSRWRKDEFRDQRFTEGWTESDTVPGWGRTEGRMAEFLRELGP